MSNVKNQPAAGDQVPAQAHKPVMLNSGSGQSIGALRGRQQMADRFAKVAAAASKGRKPNGR